MVAGGIMGVRSKSKETAFRIYKGAGTHYNEWAFLFSSVSNRPGPPPGQIPAGQRGRNPGQMPGMGPGQRGNVPGMGPGGFQPGIGGRRGGRG